MESNKEFLQSKNEFEKWLNSNLLDSDAKEELKSIANDEKEIMGRFSKSLEFGTAGLRGEMKIGLNAMNKYVIMRTTQGLANYIKEEKTSKKKEVVIVHDSRNNSIEYSRITASVLAANGIHVYLYDLLRPTPVASFFIRQYGIACGIAITASHNPKQYNGYKVFGDDGAQIGGKEANAISSLIEKVDLFNDVKILDFDKAVNDGIIEIVGSECDKIYLDKVAECYDGKAFIDSDLTVVHTPLHGSSWKLVPDILNKCGLKNVYAVDSQIIPDGNFPTCPTPNPEMKETFTHGIAVAKKVKADIIIANDPDSDRIGAVVLDNGEYSIINGNQMGVLLTNYLLSREGNKNRFVSTTLVSTRMVKPICEKYGAQLFLTITGFKNIGEIIAYNEKNNPSSEFALGFEESYGYLVGNFARDKDGVVAALLICEMAANYKKQGKTLMDVLNELYNEYGFYRDHTYNIMFSGYDATDKCKKMMKELRANPPKEIFGMKVQNVIDYSVGEYFVEGTNIPIKCDMLCFNIENNNAVVVRPSGTEPKVKLYCLLNGNKEKLEGVFKDNGEAEAFAKYLRSLSE